MWNFQQNIRRLSLSLDYALLTSNCSNFVSFWARKMLFTKKLVRKSPEFDWYSHQQPLTAKTWYMTAVFNFKKKKILFKIPWNGEKIEKNEKRMQGQYLQITSSIHGQKNPKKRPLHPLRVKWWGQKHIG